MSRKFAIIYTQPDCPRCHQVKRVLDERGYTVEEHDAAALSKGKYKDIEAMAELQMQDGAVPVVLVGGEVIKLKELLDG